MANHLLRFLVLFLTVSLTGCGTVTHIQTVQQGVALDLSGCDKVIVQDFVDKVSEKEVAGSKREEKMEAMKRVVRDFADIIAFEIKKLEVFKEVSREGSADESTLAISGEVTRHEEGDAMARLLIGFGAGSSYFEALVEFRQGPSGELVATVKVDKNSWVLGGGIAATQTPEDYMKGAAKRIAEDLYEAKTGQRLIREGRRQRDRLITN